MKKVSFRLLSGGIAAVLAATLSLATAAAAPAGSPAPVDGKAAFTRLKSLAGDWKGTIATPTGAPVAVHYQVTSGGNAVLETLFPGSDHEMTSVYYLDHGNLAMTHYCSMGNQPHLRLDTAASTADSLVFAFDGGTNFDPAKDTHIHSAKLIFAGDHLESDWNAMAGGKPADTEKLLLSRK